MATGRRPAVAHGFLYILACTCLWLAAGCETPGGADPADASSRDAAEARETGSPRTGQPRADDSGAEDADSPDDDGGGARPDPREADASPADAAPADAAGAEAGIADASPEDASALDAGQPAACQPFVRPAECEPAGDTLPQSLRCTGLYGDVATFEIACGVEAYTPAYTLFSDGSEKHRYIALPPGEQVDVSDADAFVFPEGTQVWKEFWVDVEGVMQRAETRLLRKASVGWLYTTYVWSEDGLTATQVNDGVPFVRGSSHSVPPRDACRDCHKGRADFVLGWDATLLGEGAQGLTGARLVRQGRVTVQGADGSPSTADSALFEGDVQGSELEREALGYLHANCGVSCHNPYAQAMAAETGVLLRLGADSHGKLASEVDAVTTTVNRLPGIHAKLPPGGPYYTLLPGEPEHSLLLARMDVRNETQMPPLGTNIVDVDGVSLIRRWIEAMPSAGDYPQPSAVEDGLPGPGQSPVDAGTPVDAGEPLDAGPDTPPVDAGTPVDAGGTLDAGPDTPPVDAAPPPDAGGTGGDVQSCDAAPTTSGLGYQVVVASRDLQTLTHAAQPPGSEDWYLVEMRGRILRLHDGVLDTEPFLDLRGAVNLGAGFDQTTATYDERGLVGLEFAPDFAQSGRFYVTVTPSRSNNLGLPVDHDMVVEYVHTPGADPRNASPRILVDAPSASSFLGNIHNANTLRFGPDGMLYVGMGDGGGVRCADAENNPSQDIGRVYGKILRLDLNQPSPHGARDNPFVNGGDPRVWHYGLRNPFRFSFDRMTGDLYLGDVGQDTYEELDFAPAGVSGLNFGWARFEANADCPSAQRPLRPGSSHTPPIFAANRRGTGQFRDYRAIVGGAVYRGSALPALEGAYVFGDYYGSRLGVLRQCGSSTTSPVATLRKGCDPNFPEACLAAPQGAATFESLTAIEEDHDGELYFVANGNSLLRLVAADAVGTP